MLVLSRHIGEAITIGDDITIRIVEVRPGGQVRLGIDAPREVAVHREEVRNQIRRMAE